MILHHPIPWVPSLLAGSVLLIAFGLAFRAATRRLDRRRATRRAPPEQLALDRLARLRALDPRTADEARAFHVEAAAVLRELVAARDGVRIAPRTTDELNVIGHAPERHERLVALLRPCDLAKFGRHVPESDERADWLDAAERFAREDSAG